MASEILGYLQMMDRLSVVYGRLPTMAATVAVNFTKERFRAGNWVNYSTDPWKKRKPSKRKSRSDSRAILVKSARLMRSIRKISANSERAIVGTDVPYARIHNDGGHIKVNANVKQYSRKSFSRKRAGRTETVEAATVKAHRRKVNIRMPQRRFLGASAVLDKRIERVMAAEILRAIKG
jgi:phage gpG-like protein